MKNFLILIFLFINVIGFSQNTTSPTYKKVTVDTIKARKDSIYLKGPISSKNVIIIKGDSATTNKLNRAYLAAHYVSIGSGSSGITPGFLSSTGQIWSSLSSMGNYQGIMHWNSSI